MKNKTSSVLQSKTNMLSTKEMIKILDESDPDYIHELKTEFYIFKYWPFRKKHCDEHLIYYNRFKTFVSPVTKEREKRDKYYEYCAICPMCGLVVFAGSVG